MKTSRNMNTRSPKQLLKEIDELRLRLAESEETLQAIRSGEVDALVVSGPQGERVFTLLGAERTYRILVETMNEGAMTLDREGIITYCNKRLAEMLAVPIDQVFGTPVRRLISASDLQVFEGLLEQCLHGSSKGEIALIKAGGTLLPVLLSFSAMLMDDTDAYSLVVTDLTVQKQIEQELKRHRDDLEGIVRERTYALETANQKLNEEILERKKAEEEKAKLIVELQNALANVNMLSGMLPICSSCKKIRDDQGYWTQIEAYIRAHSEAEFSHSLCPECAKKLYPLFYQD
jgi:PAS domain S-box-containing protein